MPDNPNKRRRKGAAGAKAAAHMAYNAERDGDDGDGTGTTTGATTGAWMTRVDKGNVSTTTPGPTIGARKASGRMNRTAYNLSAATKLASEREALQSDKMGDIEKVSTDFSFARQDSRKMAGMHTTYSRREKARKWKSPPPVSMRLQSMSKSAAVGSSTPARKKYTLDGETTMAIGDKASSVSAIAHYMTGSAHHKDHLLAAVTIAETVAGSLARSDPFTSISPRKCTVDGDMAMSNVPKAAASTTPITRTAPRKYTLDGATIMSSVPYDPVRNATGRPSYTIRDMFAIRNQRIAVTGVKEKGKGKEVVQVTPKKVKWQPIPTAPKKEDSFLQGAKPAGDIFGNYIQSGGGYIPSEKLYFGDIYEARKKRIETKAAASAGETTRNAPKRTLIETQKHARNESARQNVAMRGIGRGVKIEKDTMVTRERAGSSTTATWFETQESGQSGDARNAAASSKSFPGIGRGTNMSSGVSLNTDPFSSERTRFKGGAGTSKQLHSEQTIKVAQFNRMTQYANHNQVSRSPFYPKSISEYNKHNIEYQGDLREEKTKNLNNKIEQKEAEQDGQEKVQPAFGGKEFDDGLGSVTALPTAFAISNSKDSSQWPPLEARRQFGPGQQGKGLVREMPPPTEPRLAKEFVLKFLNEGKHDERDVVTMSATDSRALDVPHAIQQPRQIPGLDMDQKMLAKRDDMIVRTITDVVQDRWNAHDALPERSYVNESYNGFEETNGYQQEEVRMEWQSMMTGMAQPIGLVWNGDCKAHNRNVGTVGSGPSDRSNFAQRRASLGDDHIKGFPPALYGVIGQERDSKKGSISHQVEDEDPNRPLDEGDLRKAVGADMYAEINK